QWIHLSFAMQNSRGYGQRQPDNLLLYLCQVAVAFRRELRESLRHSLRRRLYPGGPLAAFLSASLLPRFDTCGLYLSLEAAALLFGLLLQFPYPRLQFLNGSRRRWGILLWPRRWGAILHNRPVLHR